MWAAAAWGSAAGQVRRWPPAVHQSRVPSVQTVRSAVTEMTANFCAAAVMMPVRPRAVRARASAAAARPGAAVDGGGGDGAGRGRLALPPAVGRRRLGYGTP